MSARPRRPRCWSRVARAEGSFFYTPEGKRYYDLVARVSVSNVGHCNPAVVKAITGTGRALHARHGLRRAGRKRRRWSMPQRWRRCFRAGCRVSISSIPGAEAVEGALKLAKRYTGRTGWSPCVVPTTEVDPRVDEHDGGSRRRGVERSFPALLPDVQAIQIQRFRGVRAHHAPHGMRPCRTRAGAEAGVRPPVPGYLEALRHRCDEVGALLVFDEIQTGMGRTGRCSPCSNTALRPTSCAWPRHSGGGMPLGAFVSRPEIMQTLQENPVLGHITTFGGHPVCCAAGLAALNYLLDNKVVEGVEAKGALYARLLGNHPAVREIRRSGLLLAVELERAAETLPHHGTVQAGGYPERLVSVLRHGVPHFAATDDFGGGNPRKRGTDPQMPRRIGIGRAAKRKKRVGNPLFSYYAGISRPRLPAIKHMRQLFSDDGACRP